MCAVVVRRHCTAKKFFDLSGPIKRQVCRYGCFSSALIMLVSTQEHSNNTKPSSKHLRKHRFIPYIQLTKAAELWADSLIAFGVAIMLAHGENECPCCIKKLVSRDGPAAPINNCWA